MTTPAAPISLGFGNGDAVVVTGAASGIGRATALRAAEVGLAVGVWDLDADGAAATAADITGAGGRAVACRADVTDDHEVAAAFEATSGLGTLRYLVNNAGPASASEIPFEEALLICVGSMRRVTHAWIERGAPEDAALVNLASVAGNIIGSAPDWYPASKAAIMGWTRHLAAHRSDVVRANAVAPGLTDTPRMAGFVDSELGQRIIGRIPAGRMGTPDDLAWAILFLLSPLASYIRGTLLVVDGGWTVTQ